MSFLPFLHKLMRRESLDAMEAHAAMSIILRGEATTAQIAAFLSALMVKGETPDELLGLAQAMRDNSVKVEHGITDEPLVDTCGTGGDDSGTANVSTIAAFVIAGAGVKVAKHGNRAASSRCGSADVLESLGANLTLSPERQGRLLREVGIAFLFAPAHHPAMKHAAPARAELKIRTAFNMLGPLTNPAGATVQVVGASSHLTAELMAVTLARLGLQRGFVVHGEGGLDEVSTIGPTQVFGINHGAIETLAVTPEEFGVKRATLDELRGGGLEENRAIALRVLGGEMGPHRDIVLVNAALALIAASKAEHPYGAMQLAAKSIDSGAARRKLDEFIAATGRAQ
jgi:anthranilate phosphoribosyltransferase